MRLHRLVLAIPTSLLLAAAGCGGEDAPTQAEYAEQVERICSEQQEKLQGLEEPGSVEDIPRFADEIGTTVRETTTRIERVERPSGEAGDQAERFVGALRGDVDRQFSPRLQQMKSAAESGNQRRVLEAVEQLQAIETPRTDQLARDIGAEGCAG
jgi:methyl-accepting chemotaxis protein